MKKYIITSALVLTLVLFFGYQVKANPSYFTRYQMASATSTLTYMTAGTATTTLTFDTGVGAAGGADSAILNVQFTASSTSSVLNINYEYSQDNIDWYYSDLSDQATTTPVQNITHAQ